MGGGAPGLTSGLPSRQSHPADDVADQDGDQHLDPGVPGAVEPPHHRLLLVRQVRAKINPAFNLCSRLLCSIWLFSPQRCRTNVMGFEPALSIFVRQ